VAGSTWAGLFSARDTVAVDTPAKRATSRAAGRILGKAFIWNRLHHPFCAEGNLVAVTREIPQITALTGADQGGRLPNVIDYIVRRQS
jgi:hypothetical protein